MDCALCASGNQLESTAEVNFHFHGLKSVENPEILVFAKLWVCLDCGFSRFTIPQTEVALLAACTPRSEESTSNKVGASSPLVGEDRS
jgi:hypothetical protein